MVLFSMYFSLSSLGIKTPQLSTKRSFVLIYKPSRLADRDSGDNALMLSGHSFSFMRNASTGYFLRITIESSINLSDRDTISTSVGRLPSVIIENAITNTSIAVIDKHVDITINIVRFFI
jgi:hypothetical protein